MSFINFSKLNKQAKDAWKMDQLVVGLYNDGYVLGTGRLMLWLDRKHAPNKLLSIIAEYAGFIPVSDNRIFRMGKNKEPETVVLTVVQGVDDLRRSRYIQKYIESPIKIRDTHEMGILQNRDNLTVKGLRVEYIELIDTKEVDYEVESDPAGPLTTDDPNGLVYYQNGICWIGFTAELPAKELTKHIVDTIKMIRVTKEA